MKANKGFCFAIFVLQKEKDRVYMFNRTTYAQSEEEARILTLEDIKGEFSYIDEYKFHLLDIEE